MVAVLADDARQALALPRLLVARPADGKVRVAAAPLAAVRTKVPETGHAPVALLPDHARLAATLPGLQVALRDGGGGKLFMSGECWVSWVEACVVTRKMSHLHT